MKAQTVNLIVSDTFLCTNALACSLDISGGTATQIEWDEGFGSFTPGDTTANLFLAFTNQPSTIRARVTFGATSITKSLEVYSGAPPVFGISADFFPSSCGSGSLALFYPLSPSELHSTVPYSYQWRLRGPNNFQTVLLSGSTLNSTFSETVNLGSLAPGVYTARVALWYDSNCPRFDSASFVVAPPPPFTVSGANPTCGPNGSITVNIQPTSLNAPPYFVSVAGGPSSRTATLNAAGSITFTDLPEGFYQISVEEIGSICGSSDNIFLSSTGLAFSGSTTPVACDQDSTGAINISINSSTGPVSFQWSHGPVSEDVSGLSGGIYSVTLSDATCTTSASFEVQSTTLNLNRVITPANCSGTGGAISLSVSGGQQPYSYLWSTGDSTSSLTGLNEGAYSVTITDAAGCTKHRVFFISKDPSCTQTVSGRAYIDGNGNCAYNPGEQLVSGYVSLSNGLSQWLDAQGSYSLSLPAGTYAMTHSLGNQTGLSLNCLTNGTHTLNLTSDTSGVDFAFSSAGPLKNLSVSVVPTPIRPGFEHTYFITVRNLGSQAVSPQLSFTHDTAATYLSSTAGGTYTSANRNVSWNLGALLPGQQQIVEVEAQLPASVALGTPISIQAQVLPIEDDSDTLDNAYTAFVPVVGSFDPNDKLVSLDTIAPGQRLLSYTLRFQNTGSFPASFVVLKDTLDDSRLELASFKPLGSSHPYELALDSNVMTVTYENINLPDSARDLEGSQGFFTYQILLDANLPIGTQTQNRAAIYFDFNEPVITNYATTVVGQRRIVSIDPSLAGRLRVYPNPSEGLLTLEGIGLPIGSVEVSDLLGRKLRSLDFSGASRCEADLRGLPPGTYIVRIQTEAGTFDASVLIR